MKSEFLSNPSARKNEFRPTSLNLLTLQNKRWIKKPSKLPEILFVTSFPPRECGIASYSKDLINALNAQFDNSFTCSVCSLETNSEQQHYEEQPKFILNTEDEESFGIIAREINADDTIQLIVIQHEFGLFASEKEAFKRFLHALSKPIIIVFHTVLPNPNDELRADVQELSAIASSIIVMTENAGTILNKEYALPESKFVTIPHGTHLVAPVNRQKLKRQYHLANRKVLSTFGLLGASKSIETTLNALPEVIQKHPDAIFLILGKTHPSIVKHEGEIYRNMLEEKVKTLHLENHVLFVNEYLSLPNLLKYLQLTDIYLFTSKDPNQAVSGTFSYAVSSGCPVISTPIPHAKEVLDNNNGLIFDFENSAQLASSINLLLGDEKLMAEISSNSLHRMASTAWQNSALAHMLLFEKTVTDTFQLHYQVPPINLNHVKKLTTDFGMIQFAKIAVPDLKTGYTLDDNARALIAICQHFKIFGNTEDLALIDKYLQFIKHCSTANGQFLNYIDVNEEFTPQNYKENLEDSNGRAIWALGVVVSMKCLLPINFSIAAEKLLEKALVNADQIHSTRAMAFIIKGLHYHNNEDNVHLLNLLAMRMAQMYKHEKSSNWHWFENYLTYGNSLLPEAMLCAYLTTNKDEYKQIAIESFEFLLSKIIVDKQLKVVSNKGWLVKDRIRENVIGGEQAIDVAYTVMTLERFYTIFKNEKHKKYIGIAFNWFLGANHLNQIVYNPSTGGCYDGVEEKNVNLNQGAESTLSYLLARLSIERMKKNKTELRIRIKAEFTKPVVASLE